MIYFTLSEMIIAPDLGIDIATADKILTYHISPMNPIREVMGCPVWASENSCYRDRSYELSQGRSGNSLHTFDASDKDPDGRGATDWTCQKDRFVELGLNIISNTDYSRVALYPKKLFFHCDYGYAERGQVLFVNENRKWVQQNKEQWIRRLNQA